MGAPSDIVDQANEVAELHRQAGIKQRRPEGPKATGECLNCGEPVASPRRWCDAACRDEWEKSQ
jgi:hypothetical protein